jgi:hypothetical protein
MYFAAMNYWRPKVFSLLLSISVCIYLLVFQFVVFHFGTAFGLIGEEMHRVWIPVALVGTVMVSAIIFFHSKHRIETRQRDNLRENAPMDKTIKRRIRQYHLAIACCVIGAVGTAAEAAALMKHGLALPRYYVTFAFVGITYLICFCLWQVRRLRRKSTSQTPD